MNQEDQILYPKIHSLFVEWFEREENQKQEPSPAGKPKAISDYKKTMKRFDSEEKEGAKAN